MREKVNPSYFDGPLEWVDVEEALDFGNRQFMWTKHFVCILADDEIGVCFQNEEGDFMLIDYDDDGNIIVENAEPIQILLRRLDNG